MQDDHPRSGDCHRTQISVLSPDRRAFLKLAALGGGIAWFGLAHPRSAEAAGHAEALLLSCIDYRLTDKVAAYMDGRGLRENYDQVILAGASLGAVTDKYPEWGRTFHEHLGLAIKLHDIHRVILLDHRDCGAYKLILGKDLTGDAEKRLHAGEQHRLAREIRHQQPKLAVETLLMSLDGSVETVS
jgi:carbonic anhydrase